MKPDPEMKDYRMTYVVTHERIFQATDLKDAERRAKYSVKNIVGGRLIGVETLPTIGEITIDSP
jgi:hypothetical protein